MRINKLLGGMLNDSDQRSTTQFIQSIQFIQSFSYSNIFLTLHRLT